MKKVMQSESDHSKNDFIRPTFTIPISSGKLSIKALFTPFPFTAYLPQFGTILCQQSHAFPFQQYPLEVNSSHCQASSSSISWCASSELALSADAIWECEWEEKRDLGLRSGSSERWSELVSEAVSMSLQKNLSFGIQAAKSLLFQEALINYIVMIIHNHHRGMKRVGGQPNLNQIPTKLVFSYLFCKPFVATEKQVYSANQQLIIEEQFNSFYLDIQPIVLANPFEARLIQSPAQIYQPNFGLLDKQRICFCQTFHLQKMFSKNFAPNYLLIYLWVKFRVAYFVFLYMWSDGLED